jgi:hypothetical protein
VTNDSDTSPTSASTHDGFVNGDDYDLFASFFENGESGADMNHDGFVNGDDYDFFAIRVDYWFDPC